MALSAEQTAAIDALGSGGGFPPNRSMIPADKRTFDCQARSVPLAEKGSLKRVNRKSAANGRRVKRWLIWMSNPAPAMVAKAFSEPRGVQEARPEHPEMVTWRACASPNSTWANGVNLSP